MKNNILAIDLGTTNVLAMILNEAGEVVGKATTGFTLDYPAPGLVEQDPAIMWSTTLDTVKEALNSAGIAPENIASIGITGQRTTILVWERESGRTLGPAVIWQDLRGAERGQELIELGFITVNAFTAAAKLESVLKNIPNGFQRMQDGELAWGNVDTYIAWQLSGGSVHVTDPSFACATGFFDFLTEWKWMKPLLDLQQLDEGFFPKIVDTTGIIGHTSADVFGAEVPIGAIIGDQQSAGYGQCCLEPGEAKITFGTSGTCNVNTGQEIKMTTGTYPLVFWSREGERTFCLEGMIITAGAVFSWLSEMDILESPEQAQAVAETVDSSDGVYFLPALQGLGSPHDMYDRFGAVEGLTRATTKGHLVRAAMEGVAFRAKEMLDTIYAESGLPRPKTIKVDGGASTNDALMQILADILGMGVERMTPTEATAYGAALLAGEACGLWDKNSPKKLRRIDTVFNPKWDENQRNDLFQKWKAAFGLES
ncbi:MAG: glycerol kinase [Deltaproteobacteria bacterium]|nr:glycerol kinase [Deltaproteobacteria bacterium]